MFSHEIRLHCTYNKRTPVNLHTIDLGAWAPTGMAEIFLINQKNQLQDWWISHRVTASHNTHNASLEFNIVIKTKTSINTGILFSISSSAATFSNYKSSSLSSNEFNLTRYTLQHAHLNEVIAILFYANILSFYAN